jgi:GAF domain-containing protein
MAGMTQSDLSDEDVLLRRLSAELARLHSWGDITSYILGAVVQVLGGNTGSLCLVTADRRELEIVAEQGYSDEVRAVWTTFRMDAPLPASEVASTGRPVFITSPADRDARYPIFTEQPVVQDAAYAIEPLNADGRTLGALVVGFEQPREFTADERALLGAVADRCASALSRTRRPA